MKTGNVTISVLCGVISFLGYFTVAETFKCLSDNVTPRIALYKSHLNLSCGSNATSVIFDIDVIAGNNEAERPCRGDCKGLSPDLLVQKLNCFWKNNCILDFPRAPLLKLFPGQQEIGCVGSSPSFLGLKSLKCFTESEDQGFVKDICNADSTISTKSGILLSHPTFPWHYTPENIRCSITVSFRSRYPRFLLLKALVVDIDTDANETLHIITRKDETDVNRESLVTNQSHGNHHAYDRAYTDAVRIEWSRSDVYPNNAGQGFLICYIFSSDKSVDPCEAVVTERTSSVTSYIPEPTTTTTTTTPKPEPECSCKKKAGKKRCRGKKDQKGKCRKAKERREKKNRNRKNRKRKGN